MHPRAQTSATFSLKRVKCYGYGCSKQKTFLFPDEQPPNDHNCFLYDVWRILKIAGKSFYIFSHNVASSILPPKTNETKNPVSRIWSWSRLWSWTLQIFYHVFLVGTVSALSWKIHENLFMHGSVMLTDTNPPAHKNIEKNSASI